MPASEDRLALRYALAVSAILHLLPSPFLGFLVLYGVSAVLSGELEDGDAVVLIVVALLVILAFGQFIFSLVVIIKNYVRGMAVVSGFVLVVDLALFALYLSDTESHSVQFFVGMGAGVLAQLLLFRWAFSTSRRTASR